ncbi:hypothetical protein ASH01_14305 [Terrabacter sp. Soil811]|nr:hypothetical protein ASH01_14305 [Terrabacter sp. Soil811]
MSSTSHTAQLLADVRSQLAPDDVVIKEARARRDAVRAAGESFAGGLRSFTSGSLAHGTANCPVHQRDKGLDADCGVVLDRRVHTNLGPDSALADGPVEVVEEVRDFIAAVVAPTYSRATFEITKRAILITFNEPLPSGEDPTVDVVVGLSRKDAPGLWIPNTEADTWDPSHPEQHTALLTSGPRDLRRSRARAIRLAKAENKRIAPPPLCSFNLEALGYMYVEPGLSEAQALLALWRDGATDLSARLTPDPAGISADIKVEDRLLAAARLREAAGRLASALGRDWDAEWVRRQLQPLWPDFIADGTDQGSTKARLAASMKNKSSLSVTTTGALTTGAGLGLKHPRSFGAH